MTYDNLVKERDRYAAIATELKDESLRHRRDVAKVFDQWINDYAAGPEIQFTSARDYATAAVEDCRDAVLAVLDGSLSFPSSEGDRK